MVAGRRLLIICISCVVVAGIATAHVYAQQVFNAFQSAPYVYMALLPLGWFVIGESVGFAALAIIQMIAAIFSFVGVYRFAHRSNRGKLLSAIAGAITYGAFCFVTNWLGLVMVERAFRQ